jgi:toxin ParE1/3/4
MLHQLIITDEARLDILDAFTWYQEQLNGLGNKFMASLDSTLKNVQLAPFSCQMKYNEVRVNYLDKFPFGVHYLLREEQITVIGVFHTSRDPKAWNERL